jgi:GNAT superfamily N-acetyltransferase
MRTPGSFIVPARVNELRRVLRDLSTADIALLDPSLAAGVNRPLGRELLAATWPVTESVFVCLHNLEPAGLIAIHRGTVSAQIRALAVSPDRRCLGLARTLMSHAEMRSLECNLQWLWTFIPSANVAATRCALALGFRRYRPQFLRRDHERSIPVPTHLIQLEQVSIGVAARSIPVWLGVEVTSGDEWVQPLVEDELLRWLLPEKGKTWLAVMNGNEVGCIHLCGPQTHPCVTLWLDQSIWNTPEEFAILKSVLNTIPELPNTLDVHLGSEGHLRASVERYKEYGFAPVLDERVLFAKHLDAQDDEID